MANILKHNFRKEDFLARYGGDEFLIILSLKDPHEIKNIVKRLKDNIKEFNDKEITPYKINLSIGYDAFHSDNYLTSEDFVSRIDNLMYKQKRAKHMTC